MATQTIEGVREVGHIAQVTHGQLALPPTFDNKKFAARWAKVEVETEQAKQPEVLSGLEFSGWSIWKDPKSNRPAYRGLSTGKYVLLFRAKAVQRAFNAHAGNISRKKIVREHEGSTIEGDARQDPGMLTDADLSYTTSRADAAEALALKFNEIPVASGSAKR